MPFKSKAQHRKFHEMAKEGKMSMATIRSWEAHTKSLSALPERVKASKKGKK